MNDNESTIGVTRPSVIFTVFILCWIHCAISELKSQFIPKLWSPISTEYHIFHLRWLNHKAMPRLDFLISRRNILLVDSSATVIDQNCSKTNLKSMECSGSWNQETNLLGTLYVLTLHPNPHVLHVMFISLIYPRKHLLRCHIRRRQCIQTPWWVLPGQSCQA